MLLEVLRLDANSLLFCGSGAGVRSLSRGRPCRPPLSGSQFCFEGGEDGVDGLVGGQVSGVDGQVGEAAVEGMAFVEAELGGGGVGEDGAG